MGVGGGEGEAAFAGCWYVGGGSRAGGRLLLLRRLRAVIDC